MSEIPLNSLSWHVIRLSLCYFFGIIGIILIWYIRFLRFGAWRIRNTDIIMFSRFGVPPHRGGVRLYTLIRLYWRNIVGFPTCIKLSFAISVLKIILGLKIKARIVVMGSVTVCFSVRSIRRVRVSGPVILTIRIVEH